MKKASLRLYVAGESANSRRAISAVTAALGDGLGATVKLDVVDALARPDLAERDMIIATPTLIRIWPLPKKRLVGDFSDKDELQRQLALDLLKPYLKKLAGRKY